MKRLLGRTENGNRFPLIIAAVDSEVSVNGQYLMLGVEFAHSHEAKISKIGLSILISLGKLLHMSNIVIQAKGYF
jgi:hypothetical protein